MPENDYLNADYRYEVSCEMQEFAPENKDFDNEAAALKYAQEFVDRGWDVRVWQVARDGAIVRLWISFAGALKAVE